LLDGEKMSALCREFDVSRKTGYKIFQRYKDCGLDGLTFNTSVRSILATRRAVPCVL
jgi:transposase